MANAPNQQELPELLSQIFSGIGDAIKSGRPLDLGPMVRATNPGGTKELHFNSVGDVLEAFGDNKVKIGDKLHIEGFEQPVIFDKEALLEIQKNGQ